MLLLFILATLRIIGMFYPCVYSFTLGDECQRLLEGIPPSPYIGNVDLEIRPLDGPL
jgi:hypothetical protein